MSSITAKHEIDDLTYKISVWKYQSEAKWTIPAERSLYLSWIKDAQQRIAQLESREQQ